MPLYALDGIAPRIDDDVAWIAPTAILVGAVDVGADASIWFGVVARGDNEPISIGPGSNIQDNCVLHTDMGFPLIIGDGCTIGHKAMLHGCTIGDNTLIGMGATVLNGARVGRDCLVGAGALITEGKLIPDRSLVVGAPGRIIRALDAEAIAGLRQSAAGYVRNGRRFAAGLAAVATRPVDFDPA
ncbi:gamma carbonic anhydrase family protein [uncultured Devosia sp.]|uniref:gamma carbonic anhydrase family protein n=1 Tax=uncultured Devosia sp. TaxID=211434 RepID=UPI0035CBED4A